MKYLQVYPALPMDALLTYCAPDEANVAPGYRVKVPLGQGGRVITAYVVEVSNIRPAIDPSITIKEIDSILDAEPVFDQRLVALSRFTADNYLSSIGEALDCALPSAKMSDDDERDIGSVETAISALSDEQRKVYDAIIASEKDSLHLLFGVTGSGKTEVYLNIARKVIEEGRSVIFLVPEISLSWQIFHRVKTAFADRAVLYHSALTPKERLKNWLAFYKGNAKIVVGTRSSIFMQSPDLGLIIVDEEHDGSYKEHSSPRYNTKRVAVHRAKTEQCRVIFGSATPSAESYYAARSGMMHLHELKNRHTGVELPEIAVVENRGKLLTNELKNAAFDAHRDSKQSIFLLNRRGYAPLVECEKCGRTVECDDCSINMTYHKSGKIVCHYCGSEKSIPQSCAHCNGPLKLSGTGTQKAEDSIADEFKTLSLFRLDQDSSRKKKTVPMMIEMMKNREIDILLGTQMISKGFDFPDVSVVGILAADIGLGVPDFRASERVYALLSQVSGRCGRRGVRGKVIIQTHDTENPLYDFVKNHDYVAFISRELSVRKALSYPPFSFMGRIVVKGAEEAKIMHRADEIFAILEKNNVANDLLLGPAPAPLAKLGKNFRYHIIIKSKTRRALLTLLAALRPLYPQSAVEIDIDPVDMM